MYSKSRRLKAINITVSFLFFSFLVVGYVFICSDNEYKLNQQMARGYITSDAVFFDFDNPAIKPFGNGASYFLDENNNKVTITKSYDPDFVLLNKIWDDGMTSVEKLLTLSDAEYFAALHRSTMRAVYYRGEISLPPVISGRFLTEEECLSDKCYAVVGRNLEKEIYSENNKNYYDYLGRKYEVLGITGIAGKSALDSIVFINIGSLLPEEQLDGIYYIDCSKNNNAVYQSFANSAISLFGCDLKIRRTPIAFIDIVSGKIYMKEYLLVIMVGLMLFAYINTLIQYIERQRLKISVMKLCGTKTGRILKETGRSYIIDCIIGMLTGFTVLMILLCTGFFALEYTYGLSVILGLLGASFGLAIIGFLICVSSVIKTEPQEIISQI